MEQRRKLRTAGLVTIADLAAATTKPEGMAQATFDKLRAQAGSSGSRCRRGRRPGRVRADFVGARRPLRCCPSLRPATSSSTSRATRSTTREILSRVGLEYLWGVAEHRRDYTPLWAHDSAQEREAFVDVHGPRRRRRAEFPDMHIYHYAPYEMTGSSAWRCATRPGEGARRPAPRRGVRRPVRRRARVSPRLGAVVQHQEARAALHGRRAALDEDDGRRRWRLGRGVPRVSRDGRQSDPRREHRWRPWRTTTSTTASRPSGCATGCSSGQTKPVCVTDRAAHQDVAGRGALRS